MDFVLFCIFIKTSHTGLADHVLDFIQLKFYSCRNISDGSHVRSHYEHAQQLNLPTVNKRINKICVLRNMRSIMLDDL